MEPGVIGSHSMAVPYLPPVIYYLYILVLKFLISCIILSFNIIRDQYLQLFSNAQSKEFELYTCLSNSVSQNKFSKNIFFIPVK